MLIEDGWDRALARRAFCSDLPAEVVSRRTKGEISDYLRDLLIGNLPFIQGLLLEGRLAKEGLVDRAQLASRLSMARSREQGLLAQVCDCITASTSRCGCGRVLQLTLDRGDWSQHSRTRHRLATACVSCA